MRPHIHLWRKRLRPGEGQFGESLLRYCRCGMIDPTPDDLIAEQATEAPPPEPVPDAAELPGDVKDGVAGEPDPDK